MHWTLVVLVAFSALFLPGYVWGLVLVPGKLSVLERGALSIGLSVSLVAITGLVLNFFLDLEVSSASSWGTVMALIVSGLILLAAKNVDRTRAIMEAGASFISGLGSKPSDQGPSERDQDNGES